MQLGSCIKVGTDERQLGMWKTGSEKRSIKNQHTRSYRDDVIDMEYVQNKLNIIDYIIDVPKEKN